VTRPARSLWLLTLLGLTLELGSLALLARGSSDTAVLLGFVGLHGIASAMLAPVVWATLPAALREPRRATIAVLFTLNLFVPTLLAWLRGAIWAGRRLARPRREQPIGWVDAPEYNATRERDPTGVRAGQIRAQLTSGEAPAAARLSALLSIQDAPGRITSAILRQLLADPFEDIRLLAYGMLDKKEKAISQRVLAEQASLAAAQAPGIAAQARADLLYGSNKRLAELNWELVYQKLVQGDLRHFTARAAWRHAHDALAIRADDAGLWYLIGRLGLDADEPIAGRAALERAGALGYPLERLVPWLAEYAFRERSFERVRDLFSSLDAPPGSVRGGASYQYWKY
jgi:hypothetical protein